MSFFNDWITVFVELKHKKMLTGYVESTDKHGERVFKVEKQIQIMGSWESKITVKSCFKQAFYHADGSASHLMIHGNLTKYMQGHSVFGSIDFKSVVVGGVLAILDFLGFKPNDFELHKINKGEMSITRVDITNMYRLNNNQDVEIYLRKFAGVATYRNKIVQVVGDNAHAWGTNYIQKTSRKWTLKNYNKFNDLTQGPESHRIPDYIEHRKELIGYTEGMVRHELTLRTPELRKYNIVTIKDLNESLIKSQYKKHRERISVADNIKLSNDKVSDLPRHLQATYLRWVHGLDVHSSFNNRMTFLRHRKALLEYDIDINTHIARLNDNVLPMIRILEAKPEAVPSEFENYGLVYHG